MRTLLIPSLMLCLGFAGCADHAGSAIVAQTGPQAPINQPDTKVVEGAGSNTPESLLPESNGGSNGGGSTGNSNTGGEGEGNHVTPPTNGGGSTNGQGGQGGSPVPEPGTLLLVGSGLAGLAGAALRRRQKKQAQA